MSLKIEEWRAIPGFGSDYEVSNFGKIRSLKYGRERALKPYRVGKSKAYWAVNLRRSNGTNACMIIHRAIYMAFVGPIGEGLEIDHLDNNPENNSPENLKPVTRQENMAKSWELRRATGNTQPHKLDRHCKRGHEYTLENTWINGKGYRFCKACVRVRAQLKKEAMAG